MSFFHRVLVLLLALGAASIATQALAQPVMKATAVGAVHEGHVQYPQMSPDGKLIAYEVNRPADKKTELFIVGWSGRSASGEPTKLLPEALDTASPYGASKSITHEFAFAYKGDYPHTYTVALDEGNQSIYIDGWSELLENKGTANRNSDWDPTSPRFAFSSGRTGNGDIYLWEPGMELQLTFAEADAELYPRWGHEGQRIAYVSQGRQGSHIHILDTNTLEAQPLVEFRGAESTRPEFNPDGSRIAFFSNRNEESARDFTLWVTGSRPGTTPTKISKKVHLPSKGGAAWTPDGKGLVAVLNDPDAGDPICIFPVDGGDPTCLQTGTRNNRDPYLRTVDGTWRLLYTAQDAADDPEKTWRKMYVYDIPR